MKVAIYSDELYPYYSFHTDLEDDEDEKIVDVPDEVVSRWERIKAEWSAMQCEIALLR